MKLKMLVAVLMAGMLAWGLSVQAGTTTFNGVTVDYGNAVKTSAGADVILTYKANGSLKLGGPVKARILLVAGGGSGSSGASSGSGSGKYGYGGHGGVVLDESDVLLSGDCDIAVGAGGASVNGGSSRTQGSPGGNSSIVNSFTKSIIRQAYGGGGGGDAAPSGSGTVSDITGSNKTYGANGSDKTSSGSGSAATANTGNGGQGGYGGSSSGKGGSGIVIVRLTAAVTGANLQDLVLPLDKTADEFRDASDQPVSFVFSEVTCKSSADRVVTAVETADGKLGLQGLYPGKTRVTIVKGDKTYLLDMAVVRLVTGSFRIGAYEVAVTNASEVKSVDGDLVITYLNTDAAVGKSFTLPQPTTGRLLAVGGGGAGGQDSGRDTDYGLPGGGGAGGMVMNGNQSFVATTYAITVGAGGVAPRSLTKRNGANGGDTKVEGNGTAIAKALGGGGGGARSAGSNGGCGGGGSYSSGTKNGGTKQQSSPGLGNNGGTGKHKLYGAGGGGAGGEGSPTSSSSSGAGGAGKQCDITGESIEYARGGDGGVPRVNTTYTSGGKEYWVEAEDGKPGLDGRGNGGGGSGHYSSSATYAGSGGSGIVVVRIPPYKTTVEDALKRAFAGQPATVSGNLVALAGDISGPIRIPDNLGGITIDLNGHAIVGVNGAAGDDITPGGNGQPALKIVPHEYNCESGVTVLSVTGSGSLKGGDGGKGYPGGTGASALSADGFTVNVASGIAVTEGVAGESFVQHPHKWAYTIKDNKIVAYCVADDGVPCSYRDQSRGPFVAVSAADAAYTSMRYDELTAVNGITPVTGIVIAPEMYVGRDGTDYPESSTPPREQGAYTVSMQLGDLKITSDFTITEPKPSQGSVYQAWKTAERKGRDVQIVLSATFDGSKAINDGNVLFLGSRCSAHSMDNGTVESSVNALARYANVRWYAYGSKEPSNNNVNMMTRKGEEVSNGTVTLVGGNHFVFKEMMDDLYAELVEKKNRADGYDLLILEFDGDLLGRNGESPYQLIYSLPEGWTDEKAALLRAEMNRYYDEDRVVWIVPDVNKLKSDPGWTGEYPWTSNPEFIWQRAFLNATETEGYRCPLQKNYEDTDALVAYLQEVLVGHFFSKAVIKDTLADGLTIKKVTPQMRSDGGIWRNFEGGLSHFTIPEPRSGTTVKADVERVDRQVTVTFDMRDEQAWACEHNQVIGDDFRVVIDAGLDGFFGGTVGDGEVKETNDGAATFDFTESSLDGEETYALPTIERESPTIQNVKLTPDYASEDVVRIYDGKGTNIVVKPIAPEPDEAVIRYSLDEHGTYTDNLALTNVCEKTKVWFTITDKVGEFTTVTNFATVTILPRIIVEQAEDATKPYDGTPLKQPAHSNVLSRAIAEAEKMYPGRGASAAGFVSGEGFASVPMTADSQQTEVGSHANTIDKNAVTVNDQTDKNNYVFIYLPGTLTVTPPLPMGITAFPVEKFYDAEPTNITYVVTNATGAVITDATITLREKGTDPWVPAADFVLYVDTTNVTVEVRAEKTGFTAVEAEATVVVKPRPVTLVAGSASKVYDGTPLTCDTFTVKEDETTATIPGYGFVAEEGVASVTMTPESTVTEPGSVPNVIASETAKPNTKLERNYEVTTEPGTLTVTAATMGIKAFPVEKFYDAEPTNITYVVTNAAGIAITDATITLRELGTGPWVPAADFVLYVDTTNVTVEVRAEKDGFTAVEAEATVVVKPRPVTLVAGSGSKTYDGTPLTCDTFTVKEDETTATIPGYGFVGEEGVASVTMTPESTVTEPGSVPNVIASETAKPNTKLERNYDVTTEPGTLTVTAATMGIAAFPVEKFYDAEPTNITYVVTNAAGIAITDATITLREQGTDPWIPAADFVLYVDTTNVTVQVRAEKAGFTAVEAEATVVVKPRPVTLVAGSGSKTYDGTPLTCDTFTVKEDETTATIPGYGFVAEEGVASVTMTPESTVTDPGSVPNVIASETAKSGTKLGRNYEVTTAPGTLTVTAATFTASATPYDGFYDGQEHTIEVEIQKPEEAGEATVTYSYEGGGTYLPIETFEQLKDVTAGGPVTVYAKVEVEGYVTVVVNSTVNIKPRIVVEQAESALKIYDGTPLVQPNHHEDADAEAEKSKEKWGTAEVLVNSTGFVAGEGFAGVPMTGGSTITEPGVADNVIDEAAVTLRENTKADNYIFYYLPGGLAVIQRQEEVRRDPEVVIPEESKKVIEESDKKIEETLNELVKSDPKAGEEPYIKYQLTVTPTNHLDETTRTTPEKAAEEAREQIELFKETVPDAKVDKVEFVDIVLERTYDKTEAEETAKGNYNKDNWESIDKAEEHGNKLFEVTIPVNVPEGMELIGVTRSCDSKGTEILKPKDPSDPNAEGFIYDPETKTVTLYAKEFCVFGFMMKTDSPMLRPDGDEDLCSCDEKKARTYVGTIISEELGVIGSITATLSRPNKKGIATLKAKVNSRFHKGTLAFATRIEIDDCPCSEMEVHMVNEQSTCCESIYHDLVLRFDGDTMTGWFDGDGRIDGGVDVFKTKGDPRRSAIEERVGFWNGVFAVSQDGKTSRFGSFSMAIKKSGSVSVTIRMPDGSRSKFSTAYQVGEDGIGVVPIVYIAKRGNNVLGFGFRLVFHSDEDAPRAYDLSPMQLHSISWRSPKDVGTIGGVEVARAKTGLSVVRVEVMDAGSLSTEPDEIKIKVNRTTNMLSGKVAWVSYNARGRTVRIVGTVKSGVVVNGVGYGMLSIKGMGLRPFTCACE